MPDTIKTILCVDDEQNILNSLKRLLRRENYRVLTANSGTEGLAVLKEHPVQLIISDQRMPGMNGTEFLAQVRKGYPDIIRIILTGYTEVNSITAAINEGHIYKFFLKPWDDNNLKLEIRQALEQYDLVQANQRLHQKIVEQNKKLKNINELLERKVRKRTRELEIQNQALELARQILEDMPIPILGIGADGDIVMFNRKAQELKFGRQPLEAGMNIEEFDDLKYDFSGAFHNALDGGAGAPISDFYAGDQRYTIEFTPLCGRFHGKGVIVTFRPT